MLLESKLRARREWTEDCRVFDHRQCEHIGTASSVGILGDRSFVTICGCACHWGCPSDELPLADMSDGCTCATNGEQREQNFETARRRGRRWIPSRWR